MTIAILGDEDTVLGFRLAGVDKALVFDKTKAKEQVEEIASFSLLIVTEEIGMELQSLGIVPEPVIIKIPDKTGSRAQALKEISYLFESAIGISLQER